MKKILVIIALFSAYTLYSSWVYSYGTDCNVQMSAEAIRGKATWHAKNCQNCHQVFGLGGYMGPDLTTVITDKQRGAAYTKGILMSGGNRMPDFHLSETEANELVSYLDYISQTATPQSN